MVLFKSSQKSKIHRKEVYKMALLKILDFIIKGFEEFVYMITYFVLCASRKAWSYRWLVVTVICLGGFFFYASWVHGMKTN